MAISKVSGSEVSKSLGEIARKKDNTLIVYASKENYNELHSYIVNGVIDVFQWFDKSGRQLNEEQLKIQVSKILKVANDIAELIIEEYNDMPVECINLFFKDVKKGKFGSSYGAISGADIMRWFAEFYKEYWNEFYLHADEIQMKHVKETEEKPCGAPESVQRLFNQFAGKGFKTDKECEQAKTIDQIRKDIINKNSHLYNTMSVDDANRAIENEIKIALMAEGIFE